jgi:undecaprenyl-diphosphatase
MAFFVSAALILGFGLLASEVVEGDTKHFDMAVIMAFRTPGNPADLFGPPWVEEMVRDVTALGSYTFIVLVVAAAVGYLVLVHKHALALLVAAAELGGMLVSNLLKTAFDRPRPDIEHAARVFSASFPSGHATLGAVTFLTLGALLTRTSPDRRVKLYFICIAVFLTMIVGSSRVYLGVHYPSDVLAGWCIGSAWAVLCWALAQWLQRSGLVERAP